MIPEASELPRSIAIAGAWGYIGRKFLDVALARGLTTYVHDPGPMPDPRPAAPRDPRPRSRQQGELLTCVRAPAPTAT